MLYLLTVINNNIIIHKLNLNKILISTTFMFSKELQNSKLTYNTYEKVTIKK